MQKPQTGSLGIAQVPLVMPVGLVPCCVSMTHALHAVWFPAVPHGPMPPSGASPQYASMQLPRALFSELACAVAILLHFVRHACVVQALSHVIRSLHPMSWIGDRSGEPLPERS